MSSGRPVVHQDYIAKIRYSNALPPPPCPPKLLDMPNTGLSSGQYTSAGFASRLAREQSLNIEADAELGMPIDLVGIPKVFDGDESGKRSPGRKRLPPTDASYSHPRYVAPATAQSSGQGVDATTECARQEPVQCLGRYFPATNRICHLKHNWRLQIRIK
jgi:hypothetical protein